MSIVTVVPVALLLTLGVSLVAPLSAGTGHHTPSGHGDHSAEEVPVHEHHWQAPSAAAARINPHAADDGSIRRGQEVYRAQCLVCHGASGAGDGPMASELGSRPADFRKHAAGHSAGEYHWVIREGSGEMPAFAGVLEDAEIWHVVRYIQDELADAAGEADGHDGHSMPHQSNAREREEHEDAH